MKKDLTWFEVIQSMLSSLYVGLLWHLGGHSLVIGMIWFFLMIMARRQLLISKEK